MSSAGHAEGPAGHAQGPAGHAEGPAGHAQGPAGHAEGPPRPTDGRPDVAAFELITRALIGIALESITSAGKGVTLPQFRLLLALEGLGRVPSSKLAGHLGLAASAITRMVDRLEQADLVQRGADARSRSIVTVELTSAGQDLVTGVLAHRHARLAAVLDRMSPEDRIAAVHAAREFGRLSGDAVALGATGPVPT